PPLPIDPSPVLPGTTVHATGYAGLPLTERHDWEGQIFRVRLERRLELRQGLVVERHLGGLRQFKWPVFQVDTSLDSGMSGGPILELRGNEPIVRGVICGDLTLGDNPGVGSGAQAFATELWPTLMMPARLVDN